jgi:hypothetical protein
MRSKLKLMCFFLGLALILAACNLPIGNSAPETPPVQPEGEPEGCTNQAALIEDISIPDGSLMTPGSRVTKTWRIQNSGTCAWTTDYIWEQINYENASLKMASLAAPLVSQVAPGESLDISVELSLDNAAALGSSAIAKFKLHSPEGEQFGDSAYALVFASPGAGVCPVGTPEQATHINPVLGFCFLYPAGYQVRSGETGATILSAPANSGGSEQAVPTVSASSQGDAGGLSSADWAGVMVEAWAAPGSTVNVEAVQIGGADAYQTDDLPGMLGNRNVFIVHNGNGLVFNVMPVDGAFQAETDTALQLWDLFSGSLVFFTPGP